MRIIYLLASHAKCATYLVATAPIFAIVKLSTWKIRPIISVKKPGFERALVARKIGQGDNHTPLMLDKIVALATLVIPRPALSDQFARNQRKQKIDAN